MLEWLRSKFAAPAEGLPRVSVMDMAPSLNVWHDGETYPGGFGPTEIPVTDYWTLRWRSADLYQRNHYARGIIRRLVTNVINTGLHLESVPSEMVLGLEDRALSDWTEMVEERFWIWGKDPRVSDFQQLKTFGAQQAAAYLEAMVVGDVLCVLRQDPRTNLPRLQLINGASVQTSIDAVPRRGNEIVHGVELDPQRRQVAYWVAQGDGTSKRVPAWGERSGRRIAWLLYGTDMRLDDVRGQPLLSVVLQSLKEILRYRDAVQRKAQINAVLAMFIEKSEDKPGTRPITGGAIRKDKLATDMGTGSTKRTFEASKHIPGLVIEELQVGEKPSAHPSHGTDEKFADFEAAILGSVAWALELPGEILQLAFSNNYSASQAAINEFKIFLDRARQSFGEAFCQPIYVEWLISEALIGRVDAPGLVEAWRDVRRHDEFGAWIAAEWSGHVKPSTDILKQARGHKMMLDMGVTTRDRVARELMGTKYSRTVKRLLVENQQLVEALAPLQELSEPPEDGEGFGDGGSQQEPGEEDDGPSARMRLLG